MKPLEPPDSLHLQVAQGWLELGNPVAANQELDNIPPELRAHPAVMEVRRAINAMARNCEAALNVASALAQTAPEPPLGGTHQSFCLRELRRIAEARDNLLGVADRFPDDAIIRYNLACYECQLGRLERAEKWLEEAFALGEAWKIKLRALEDPDLAPPSKDLDST